MSIPGFKGESSIYRGAVTYYSAQVGGGRSSSGLRPAQGPSSCWASCFERCFSGCVSQPIWTWGTCINNCNAKCNQQPCPALEVCQNGSCVCAPPFTDCNGTCTSLLDDPNNCGACGVQCPPGNYCAPSPFTGVPECAAIQ